MYRVTATTIDAAGNESLFAPVLTVIVDTEAPATPDFGLVNSFSALQYGPTHTTQQFVSLVGQTSADAVLHLEPQDIDTVAAADGQFLFTDVELSVGTNSLSMTAVDLAGNTSVATATITMHDIDGPVIEAALINDTGRTDLDGITADPAVSGTIQDASGLNTLRASIDSAPFQDVSAYVMNAMFSIDAAALDLLNGWPLEDGQHTVALRGVDTLDNTGQTTEVMMTLDRQAPLAPTTNLLPQGDTYFSVIMVADTAGTNGAFGGITGPSMPPAAPDAPAGNGGGESDGETPNDPANAPNTPAYDAKPITSWSDFLAAAPDGPGSSSSTPGNDTVLRGAYRLTAVAKTSDDFTDFGAGVSINSQGHVAFVGMKGSRENIYVAAEGQPATKLMNSFFETNFGDPLNQHFGGSVQINDLDVVLAQRFMLANVWVGVYTPFPVGDFYDYPLTYLEKWYADPNIGIPTQELMGDAGMGIIPVLPIGFGAFVPYIPTASFFNPIWGGILLSPYSSTDEFMAIYPDPTLNNNGATAAGAWLGRAHDGGTALVTHTAGGYNAVRVGDQPQALLADTDEFILRNGDDSTAPIVVATADMSRVDLLADAGDGVTHLGRLPGISDDGRVAAFGMSTVPEPPDPAADPQPNDLSGIFISVKNAVTGRFDSRFQIAGLTGNGVLEFGEDWLDMNGNGTVDKDEDIGPYSGFPWAGLDQRVAVTQIDLADDPNTYRVSFLAEDTEGVLSLQLIDLVISDAPNFKYETHVKRGLSQTLARIGDPLPGVGNVSQIFLHDPLSTQGQIAFRAEGTGGTAVIVATPNMGDLVLHKFGSAAPNGPLDLVQLDYEIKLAVEEKLTQPLYVSLYASDDGVFGEEDRLLGQLKIDPSEIGPGHAITALGGGEEPAKAKFKGKHSLLIDPAKTSDEFLQKALEDHNIEVIFAKINPDSLVNHHRDVPGNNTIDFAGLYQQSAGSIGVTRSRLIAATT